MCQNEQCRHPYTCACESCECSDNMLCECEHEAHEGDGCEARHKRKVQTPYGTFKLCITCYERGHMQPGSEPVFTPLPEGFEGF